MENQDYIALCIQYAQNNLNTMVYDVNYTYSRMCMEKTPLYVENERLFYHIQDLIDDFITDYELDEDWADMNGIYVDYIFEKILDYHSI